MMDEIAEAMDRLVQALQDEGFERSEAVKLTAAFFSGAGMTDV